MRTFLLSLLCFGAVSSYAQSGTPIPVPAQAVSQLEDIKELTKSEVAATAKRKAKGHAETRPELNRYLVISADEFLRVATSKPTKEAYLECIDRGLSRVGPLTTDQQDRQQVAEYYQELMDIVGLDSSEGKLAEFVSRPTPR
jgi:hypothetical protein